MTKEYEYEIVRHDKNRDTVGRVWWNGKKVDSDNKALLGLMSSTPIDGLSIKDGISYLEKLPRLFNNGYVQAKRV